MDIQNNEEDADEDRRSWGISRRRKLIVGIILLMMMALVFDSSENGAASGEASQNDSSGKVTVDEFDRIEELLATTENQRVEGRGPTVEVPSDIAFEDDRPSFDFDAFDRVMADASADAGSDDSATTGSKAPSRDSFDDLNRVTVLQIPDQMALGSGHRVIKDTPVSTGAEMLADSNLKKETAFELSDGKAKKPASVRILASDVTSSKVTQFSATKDDSTVKPSDGIRFTGTIFPVSRRLDRQ